MMDQAFFREQIQLIRSEFFPRWDRGKEWRVSLSSNPEHLGDGNDSCNSSGAAELRKVFRHT
jgi:hypothetical protein